MKTGAVPHEGQTGAWCWVRGSYNTLVVSSPAASPAHWHVTLALTAGSMSSQCQKLAWLTLLLVLPRLTPSRHEQHLMIPVTHRYTQSSTAISKCILVSQSVAFFVCFLSVFYHASSQLTMAIGLTVLTVCPSLCQFQQDKSAVLTKQ